MKKGRQKVLFICGADRSGTTIIERVVGQESGFVAVGEMARYIWIRGALENESCGCGTPFRDCGFWQDVLERSLEDASSTSIRRARNLQRVATRIRRIPQLLLPGALPESVRTPLEQYLDLMRRINEGISDVSGERIVCDSSKRPVYGALYQRAAGLEVYVLHVVRDSRAVAHSWTRRKARPEAVGKTQFMPTRKPWAVAWSWMTRNLAAHALRRGGVKVLRVRYEDFAENPADTVRNTRRFLGESGGESRLEGGSSRTVFLGTDHTVSGNPARFLTGETEIRMDQEWRRTMGRVDRLLVTVLTAPLLVKYGYPKW